MKKQKLYLSLLTIFLIASCGSGGGESSQIDSSSDLSSSEQSSALPSSSEEAYPLEDDPAENYVFEGIDNAEGSMSYEIFTRSFYDEDGDGTGDFNGITYQLDYLKQMGIKTLWLTPIHPSPTYHGYDVKDYFDVCPDLGTMDDFDNLVKEAGERNIDIMLDMVFNHCSNKNEIFIDSYYDFIYENEAEDSKANWFNWSTSRTSVCAVQYPGDGNAWYEARFDKTMPDFNFDCQAVRDYIEEIMRFWIVDHGVKGFRLDAVKYYYYENTAKNVDVLTWLEETAHKYDPDFYMVGECWSADTAVNKYHDSKLDSFFRFEGSYEGGQTSIINAAKGSSRASTFVDAVVTNVNAIKSRNPKGYPSYFLSNHDMDRSSHAFSINKEAIKMAASILALLPGTPFMYYGEEIGLLGKRVTNPDDMSDARRRLPIIWSETDKTGECAFPEKSRTDLARNNEQVELGVYDRQAENFSLLNHYRKAIEIRNKYPFLKTARVQSLVADLNTESTKVIAYKIYKGNDYIIVVHNCDKTNLRVHVEGSEIVDQINTSHKIPTYENNELTLGPNSTVVIK